jgi:hypothetical protein
VGERESDGTDGGRTFLDFLGVQVGMHCSGSCSHSRAELVVVGFLCAEATTAAAAAAGVGGAYIGRLSARPAACPIGMRGHARISRLSSGRRALRSLSPIPLSEKASLHATQRRAQTDLYFDGFSLHTLRTGHWVFVFFTTLHLC